MPPIVGPTLTWLVGPAHVVVVIVVPPDCLTVSYLPYYYCICLCSGWVYLRCYCCYIISCVQFPVEVVVVV
jgi:hypothetical protein